MIANLCPVTFSSSGPAPINGASFQVTVSAALGSTILRGSFSSASAATGNLEAFTITAGCRSEQVVAGANQDAVSWTASKS